MQKSFSISGRCDTGENLKQGGFPGTIATHDPDDIAFFNLEARILERPKVKGRGHAVRGFLKDRGVWIRLTKLARDPALDLVNQHLAVDDPKAVFFWRDFLLE
jgi:hypothetical protein